MKEHRLKPGSRVLLLSLVIGLLSGCEHKTKLVGTKAGSSQATRIAVMVHGPFAAMVGREGLRELMPRSKDGPHELVFPYPGIQDLPQDGVQKDGCKITIQFELKGVESAEKTEIDPAFDPVRFSFPDRKHIDDDFFVTMKLPLPRRMDGLGLYPVRFGLKDPGPIEYVPLTQVLEFAARDIHDVQLVETKIKKCDGAYPSSKVEKLPPISPIPCRELRQKYEEYFRSTPDPESGEKSERPFLRDELRRCRDDSGFFFIGVGLDRENTHGRFEEHAVRFFNDQLLPLISGGEPVPDNRKLAPQMSREPHYGYMTDTPMLRPAVYAGNAPRLVLVAGHENCTAALALNVPSPSPTPTPK